MENEKEEHIIYSSQEEVDVYEFIDNRLNELHNQGYLQARLDTIISATESQTIVLFTGKPYFYKLSNDNISTMVLKKLNLENYFTSEPFPYVKLTTITQKLLTYYGNHGYPFARIYKSDIQISGQFIHAKLTSRLMESVIYDSIVTQGDINLTDRFLEAHLGIKKGALYNEKDILEAENKLRYLNFLQVTGPVGVSFSPGRARVILPLSKKRSNRFDGIAGVVSSDDPLRPIQLTGTLNLYLINALEAGESFDMVWQGLGNGTQILSIKVAYPYIIGLPLGVQAHFSLHRQDSTWIQILQQPAVNFQPSTAIQLSVFAKLLQNNLLATRHLATLNSTPQNLDFRSNMYGISILYMTSAYDAALLQKGHRVNLSVAAGQQTIKINNNLPQAIYDDLALQTNQVHLDIGAEKRWRTSNVTTLNLQIENAWNSGKDLFENQLFRLGGYNSLKGFDESSLLASAYSFTNLEFRVFASEGTYFSAFVNGGWYERNLKNNYYKDFPVGFGTGLNLETQAGIFAIYLALGTQRDVPVEIRNSKIHIGYTSVF